ncbi:MAG: L,D-transpeptidase family protein, partial [Bdellovibrionales bacterium]|nr:L,D-transpeptidase family protein [Bdellovibrionales bacterium]
MKKFVQILSIAVACALPISSFAEGVSSDGVKVMPAPLLQLDNFFAHHVLVAEKSTHSLHLFKNTDGRPELVRTYQIATGKKPGDKESEGDFRTPEGVYNFVDFLTNKQLLAQSGPQGAIYGAGAFVTDYPNVIDRNMKKTGSGIWLHSTNDETRIDKGLDSRGCVVTANQELIDVSKYLELNKTPIV